MGKLYFKSSKEEIRKELRPRKETIRFLLNYSKAFSVIDGKRMKYEMFVN